MKHKFTVEERRKGGWSRARQKADYRRAHPTELEAQIRAVLDRLHIPYLAEYEIWNDFGPYPQWIDIFVQSCKLAIEIDGSHSWHDPRYPSSKMYDYDQAKQEWCSRNGIRLVTIHDWFYDETQMLAIVQPELLQPEILIPF